MTDSTQGTTPGADTFIQMCGRTVVAIGCLLYVTYLLYLPFPHWFVFEGVSELGLAFYGMATAGSAAVAWGGIMAGSNGVSLKRSSLFRSSALGFLLLGGMRLGTCVFPHAPFEDIRFVALTECIVFVAVAFKLYRTS